MSRLDHHPVSLFERTKQKPSWPRENQGVGADGEVAGIMITVSTFSRRKRWILEYTANSAIDPRMMSIRTTPPLGTRDEGGPSPAGFVEFTCEYRRLVSAGKLHSF
jgi:hypothetical protein